MSSNNNNNNNRNKEEQEDHPNTNARDAASLHNLFARRILGGFVVPPPAVETTNFAAQTPKPTPTTTPSSNAVKSKPVQRKNTASENGDSSEPTEGPERGRERGRNGGLLEQVISLIQREIPSDDPAALRDKVWYQHLHNSILWQRDNYLVGREYANWRRKDRDRDRERMMMIDDIEYHYPRRSSVRSFLPELQYDATALGHIQIAPLLSNFIPSPTVKQALLPIVTPLFGGVLYPITQQSLIFVIQCQQDALYTVIKSSLISFLNHPQTRSNIKNCTRGYIASTQPNTTITSSTSTTSTSTSNND